MQHQMTTDTPPKRHRRVLIGIVAGALMLAAITVAIVVPLRPIIDQRSRMGAFNDARASLARQQAISYCQQKYGFTPLVNEEQRLNPSDGPVFWWKGLSQDEYNTFTMTGGGRRFLVRVYYLSCPDFDDIPANYEVPALEDASDLAIGDNYQIDDIIDGAYREVSERLGLPEPATTNIASLDHDETFVSGLYDGTNALELLAQAHVGGTMMLAYDSGADFDAAAQRAQTFLTDQEDTLNERNEGASLQLWLFRLKDGTGPASVDWQKASWSNVSTVPKPSVFYPLCSQALIIYAPVVPGSTYDTATLVDCASGDSI